MKRIVLKCGVIAGVMLSILSTGLIVLTEKAGLKFSHSEVFGYTMMVLAYVMVFVGIRTYREDVAGGTITFGKGFQVGILITLITCAFYVVSWEIVSWNFLPDFAEKYSASVIQKLQASGASAATVAAKQHELAEFQEMYKNPLFNIGMTFLEVFPPGLIITLVSAAILRRKEPRHPAEAAVVAG